MTEPTASDESRHKPAGWYRGPEGKRWWDGQAWSDQPPASERGTSALAVASMMLGVAGLLVAINAIFKAKIFLGVVDVFGPVLLGALAVILAVVAGKRSFGMRLTGILTGGFAVLLGVIIIIAVVR